jgi:ribosome-associated protein
MQDLKALDILLMDLREIPEASAAYFVICHGSSSTHLSGIADRVDKNIWEKYREHPTHTEGRKAGNWVLMDYFNVVVHIFDKNKREFYDLEGLWSDAKIERYENL